MSRIRSFLKLISFRLCPWVLDAWYLCGISSTLSLFPCHFSGGLMCVCIYAFMYVLASEGVGVGQSSSCRNCCGHLDQVLGCSPAPCDPWRVVQYCIALRLSFARSIPAPYSFVSEAPSLLHWWRRQSWHSSFRASETQESSSRALAYCDRLAWLVAVRVCTLFCQGQV